MFIYNKFFFWQQRFVLFLPFLLERYYYLLLDKVFSLFINGFLLRFNKLYVFTSFFFLHLLFAFFEASSFLGISSLCDIVVVDYPLRVKGRFELTYCLLSHFFNFRFFIKAFTNLVIPSVRFFFFSAGWLEREIWDLFGLRFLFHNDMRRILTDYGFKGHPLRKDFPLIGFVEVRYDDIFQSILIEKVELSQKLRVFRFFNPWVIWR